MHNSSNQQVGQAAQRATELDVEPLSAGVGRDFGSKTGQKPLQGLSPVALQGENVLELVYDSLDDLAFSSSAQRRSVRDHALLELSLGVATTRAPCSCAKWRSHAMEENPLSAR
jgi:hypothetical protein